MKRSLKQLPVLRIARILLFVYAAVLTGLVVFALTAGPFQETFHLWSKASLSEEKLKESERARKKLETERDRLLKNLKNLQADWTRSQETIQALRELVKNPENEKRLMEANQMVDKLSQERAVLISKLNELRQILQTRADKELKKP